MIQAPGFYNMDCMDALKQFPDKFFSLAIVDPPYGINAPKMHMGSNKSRKGDGYPGVSAAERLRKGRLNQGAGKLKGRALQRMDCSWDSQPPSKEYFQELFRVSQNQIIWGGNYFELPPTRGIVAWDKVQPWENFSQFELAWTSFDVPAALFRYSNTGGANAEEKIHPTQKPIPLYTWTLSKFAKSGHKILDTHVGSASSLIACHLFGYQYWGYEKDEQIFMKASERLEKVKAQVNMFELISS